MNFFKPDRPLEAWQPNISGEKATPKGCLQQVRGSTQRCAMRHSKSVPGAIFLEPSFLSSVQQAATSQDNARVLLLCPSSLPRCTIFGGDGQLGQLALTPFPTLDTPA
jgi:hypothetical protein